MSGTRRPSILIPLYNEEEFISPLLKRVLAAPLPDGLEREVIIVDDGSKDGSLEIAAEFSQSYPETIQLIRHAQNQGKGSAIRTAIENATGEFCIIQDADLEYDPREYARLLKPLIEEKADAVFGSRFMNAGERRVLYYWHSVGNRLLTTLCNIFADLNLTDMETCYKAFRTSLIQSIPIRGNRFGIEPELTIKLAQRQARIYAVFTIVQTLRFALPTLARRNASRSSPARSIQWSASMYSSISRTTWRAFVMSIRCCAPESIILVPHGQEIFGTLDTALGHCRRYSEAELRDKMERVGLPVERVIMFNRISRPAWYIRGKILKKTALGRRQMMLFDRFVWLWRRIDSLLPWPSTSLIAIGVKRRHPTLLRRTQNLTDGAL